MPRNSLRGTDAIPSRGYWDTGCKGPAWSEPAPTSHFQRESDRPLAVDDLGYLVLTLLPKGKDDLF